MKLYLCASCTQIAEFIAGCIDFSKFEICEYAKLRHHHDIPNIVNRITQEAGPNDKIVCIIETATNPDEFINNCRTFDKFYIHTDNAEIFYLEPFFEEHFGIPREFSYRVNTEKYKEFVRAGFEHFKRNPVIKEINDFINK